MKAAKRSFFCNAVAEQASTIGSTGLLVDVSHILSCPSNSDTMTRLMLYAMIAVALPGRDGGRASTYVSLGTICPRICILCS